MNQILETMNSLLYLIAVILIIGWILGFFVYSAGSLIHALLVLAIIAILINIIRGRAV
ncbi:lmo0937 family membrane protein [Chitinophaga sp.]